MYTKRIGIVSGIAAVGMVVGLTAGTGSAFAAPTEPSANETIARLQAEGNRVVINRVGAGQDCSITSVQTVRTPQPPAPRGRSIGGNPQMGNAFQQHQPTVHVGVRCK